MKKVILVLVFLVILLPCTVFADDGSMLDVNRKLTHEFVFENYECEFGGTIDYKVNFKNTDPRTIVARAIHTNGIHYYEWRDCEIDPGQIKTMIVTGEEVLPFYQWYPKEDGYYTDMYMNYGIDIGGYEQGFLELYFCYPPETTPLKITNLNDGSDYIEISGIDETGFIDFYEPNLQYNDNKNPIFLDGQAKQAAKITNVSDEEIKLILREDQRLYYSSPEYSYVPLKPGESIDWDFIVERIANWEKPLRNSELLNFYVTFMVDDEYYGAYEQRVYKSRYFPFDANLKFDVTVFEGEYKSLDEDYDFCKIDITNKGMDIPDFKYIFSDQNLGYMRECDEYKLYEEDFSHYGTFSKGDTISVYKRIKKNSDIFGCFGAGDDLTNYWEYYELGNSGKDTNYTYFYSYRFFDKKQEISEEVEKVNEDAETETNESEKEQAVEVTAQKPETSPSPQVKVVETQDKSSMPVWVGIVLGASLLGSIAIIIALRKNNKLSRK